MPQIRASEFFSQLEERGGAYYFAGGPLNGWPGLVGLELVSITCAIKSLTGLRKIVKRFWDATWKDPGAPTFFSRGVVARVFCDRRGLGRGLGRGLVSGIRRSRSSGPSGLSRSVHTFVAECDCES